MEIWMDVDAAVVVPVNKFPLIDDTDFKSREPSVAYNAAGMDLVWNFVTPAGVVTQTAVTPTTGGDYDWAHRGDAMYVIEIPASGGASINNDTEGFGWFTGICDGVLAFAGPIIGFRPAAINNALVRGSSNLSVAVASLAANVITTASINDGAFTLAKFADGCLNAAKFASGAFDAVWTVATRSLTTFGSLVADIWANGTRTLSSFGTLAADVWSSATRALTSTGNAAIAAADLQILATGTLQSGSTTGARLTDTLIPITNGFQNCALLVIHASGFREVTGIASSSAVDDTVVFSDAMKVAADAGETFYILAGAASSIVGNPDVNLNSIGGSTTDRERLANGLKNSLPFQVVTAGFTPTTTQFEVDLLPVFGNVANIVGRDVYFRTGDLNHCRREISAVADSGAGIYRLTVTPALPEAPAGDDTGDVI